MIHGGGFSGLTWAVLSATLTKLVKCRTLAVDVRGHGNTKTSEEDDISADRLARDIGKIVSTRYKDETAPPIILVGHSMGGAIAIHSAVKNLVPSLAGMVVIDVVEGSALEALQSMQSFLKGRPKQFQSIEYAIEWVTRTGQIKNLESARVSMIGQLQPMDQNEMAEGSSPEAGTSMDGTITEEGEEAAGETENHAADTETVQQPYTWRVDLSKTEPYWKGWFQGMSNLFLSVPVPKMLLLAGVDRLDKDLAIGHMQGKFQMQVLSNCGHTMQEDQPQKVAEAIATFLLRHKMTEALSGFERLFPSC
ncbi:protein phosphatase methylesterase 1-like isoform X2 [Apostichopus japonicus]